MGSFTLKDDAERKRRIDKVFELFPVLAERAGKWAGCFRAESSRCGHRKGPYDRPEGAAS